MYDQRLDLLASLLVNYCVETKPGDVVRINGLPQAGDLIRAVYREVLKASGHPLLRLRLDGLDEVFFRHASETQIDFVTDVQRYEVEHIQASIGIWGARQLAGNGGDRFQADGPPQQSDGTFAGPIHEAAGPRRGEVGGIGFSHQCLRPRSRDVAGGF